MSPDEAPRDGSLAAAEKELTPTDVEAARDLRERLSTAVAFIVLLVVDVVLKLAGFQRFHGLVERLPVRSSGGAGPDAAVRIAAAVDRASTLYFKRAWCLQRSAAAVCLMRLRGLPADLVIGVRRLPFYAHAWVEIEGVVVNDHPVVQTRFTVLDRCTAVQEGDRCRH
ncbi:MAG: lasso peptide biosynthesis B2 protein [Thermoanaerobaculia bacterium]|nr:lasso peptide biosynthesis B2 protein [Thermoanaerobaculia bacterium]